MADYTIKNLREIEDSAPDGGLAPQLEARFATGELGLTRSGISLQRIAPNQVQPFGHRHKEQEELYVILDGSGRAKLDDEVVEVRPLDAIRVAPAITRAFAAGPEGLELLAFGAPALDSPAEDVESEPGWWNAQPMGARLNLEDDDALDQALGQIRGREPASPGESSAEAIQRGRYEAGRG